MEAVVICPTGNSIPVGRTTHIEFIVYCLVLENFTQLWLHSLIEVYCVDWLLRIADIPYLHCQIVSWNYVLSLFAEISWAITRQKISEEILLSRVLVFKISSSGVWIGWDSHVTQLKCTLIGTINQEIVSCRVHFAEGYVLLNIFDLRTSHHIGNYVRFLVFLVVPEIGMYFITW